MNPIQAHFSGRICYGYIRNANDQAFINEQQAQSISFIFERYLCGDSLAKIVEVLQEQQTPSPTGKVRWTRAAIDKLLSNIKYVPHIISSELFLKAQNEKIARSNQELGEDGMQRKATRYNSQNVLSGLLVCAECGTNYRRITRDVGEVVWRCANRVEHGKEICKHSSTVTEETVISFICNILNLQTFNPQTAKELLEVISVNSDRTMTAHLRQAQSMPLSL